MMHVRLLAQHRAASALASSQQDPVREAALRKQTEIDHLHEQVSVLTDEREDLVRANASLEEALAWVWNTRPCVSAVRQPNSV